MRHVVFSGVKWRSAGHCVWLKPQRCSESSDECQRHWTASPFSWCKFISLIIIVWFYDVSFLLLYILQLYTSTTIYVGPYSITCLVCESNVTTLRRLCGIEYCGCVCVCFILILMFCWFACKIYEYEYEIRDLYVPAAQKHQSDLLLSKKNPNIKYHQYCFLIAWNFDVLVLIHCILQKRTWQKICWNQNQT